MSPGHVGSCASPERLVAPYGTESITNHVRIVGLDGVQESLGRGIPVHTRIVQRVSQGALIQGNGPPRGHPHDLQVLVRCSEPLSRTFGPGIPNGLPGGIGRLLKRTAKDRLHIRLSEHVR